MYLWRERDSTSTYSSAILFLGLFLDVYLISLFKNVYLRENKMAEKSVNMEYVSLHRYIRNTPSDTEVHAEHQLRVDRST